MSVDLKRCATYWISTAIEIENTNDGSTLILSNRKM